MLHIQTPPAHRIASVAAHIALSSLFVSQNNVRKVAPAGIEELAVMIEAQGLLQALHVTAEIVAGAHTGRYGVEAGGRRLRALHWLAEHGRIASDTPVECRVITDAQALEVSLTENISQEGMHPADEFEAYQKLVTDGQSIEAVAAKFGVTVVHVQRRLKMANVAPELLALYRSGVITLDQIMALTSTDDQQRQVLTWHSLPSHSRHAHAIKRKLIEDEVIETDSRVTFVGLDTYLAAGGTRRTDLFSTDETAYLTDLGLLTSLMAQRLETEAAALRAEGWAWVEVLPTFDYPASKDFILPGKSYLPETPEIETARMALNAELENYEREYGLACDAGDQELVQKLNIKATDIEEKLEALQESLLDSSGFDKTVFGAVVSRLRGDLIVHRGVMARKDQLNQAGEDAGASSSSTRTEVPEKLMLNLSSHRTAAMQVSMIANPGVTLAALANKMAYTLFSSFLTSPIKISLTPSRSALERHAPTLVGSRAGMTLNAAHAAWKARLPAEPKDWFGWFLSQPEGVSIEMIVYGTAHCADALQGDIGGRDDAGPLTQALSLDMADWWEATPETYLELVPKAKLIDAVTETAGAQVAGEMSKMKKGEACVFAASHLSGKRWLPTALRSKVSA